MTLSELSNLIKSGQTVALATPEGSILPTNRPNGKDFTAFMLPYTDVADEEVAHIDTIGSTIRVQLNTTRKTANVLANLVKRESAPLWFYNEVNGANCRYTREQLAELRHKTNMYGNK